MVLSYNVGTRVKTPKGIGTIIFLPKTIEEQVDVVVDGELLAEKFNWSDVHMYFEMPAIITSNIADTFTSIYF